MEKNFALNVCFSLEGILCNVNTLHMLTNKSRLQISEICFYCRHTGLGTFLTC